jgi:hypothetical protein
MVKTIKILMATLSMLMFVACGGGSDNSTPTGGDQNNGNTPNSALAGKTLYFSEDGEITGMSFDEAMSVIVFSDGYVIEIEKIVENKIYLYDEDEDGIYLLMAESTEKYVLFKKGDDREGVNETGFKAYFNKEDAN